MIIHFLKSINWIDAALVVLFVRMIFIGVKNGFISEFTKSLGIVVAVFVSLHYYSFLAAWVAKKTNMTWEYWDLVLFAALWLVVALFFKLVKDSLLYLFKVETTHQGFDKYAAGVVAVGRGILVCSMTMFLILLAHHAPLSRMTLRSYSYKIAGHAAVSTYSFLFNHLISKFCVGEHYNAAVVQVVHPAG
jgi:uncharacterized membrane protein required for colicin V production